MSESSSLAFDAFDSGATQRTCPHLGLVASAALPLPEENKKNVFDRMRAERARQAKEYRAEGEEVALKIKAETDLEVTRIQSNAFQKAQFIRGQGDAEALKIYADAFQQDPKFYEFQRTLEAYEKTLGQGTTVVLPLGTDFFKYLGQSKK